MFGRKRKETHQGRGNNLTNKYSYGQILSPSIKPRHHLCHLIAYKHNLISYIILLRNKSQTFNINGELLAHVVIKFSQLYSNSFSYYVEPLFWSQRPLTINLISK